MYLIIEIVINFKQFSVKVCLHRLVDFLEVA